ncbi:sugar transporter [Thermoplasma volcanium GSS1]|uniref:Sugar transporter n=1 Tax=Thermoplasma volcanium (strain ATCC 51530 / DSM 4299 / JCM 9571 / NBRC 15438 / GSS1) TaxID=273116 RepID=Q97BZ9_THEVO|nr:MFS transporter [Thermoplasma volcanium]BAB59448.1 sugar transporter [Thermoplasma volcanium GSS1]
MFSDFDSKLTRFQIKTVIVSGIGIFSDSYNLYAIALVYYIAAFYLNLTPPESALMTSGAFIGAAIGAILFGLIADKIGRKPVYGLDLALITLGSFLQFFAVNFTLLLIFRIILGLGIGGDYVLSPIITAENANSRDRGKLMIMTFPIMAAFGAMLAAFVDQVSTILLPSSLVWKIVLAFGGVPALFVIYFRRKITETARYSAIVKGSSVDIMSIEKETGTKIEITRDTKTYSYRLKTSLVLVLISSVLWILYDMYSSTFAIYGPITIAKNLGLTPISFTYYAEIFAGIPGAIVSAMLIDKIGRKRLITIGYLGVFFWLLLYGLLLMKSPIFGSKILSGILPTGLVGEAAFAGFSFYIMNYLFSAMGPASIIGGAMVTPEITPTKARGTSQAITVGLDRTADALGLTAFPLLLARLGLPFLILGFSAIAILSIIIMNVGIPEARGKSLEEITGETADTGIRGSIGK